MKTSKIALLGLGAMGLVLATTAQAAATRAAGSLPVASVKAKKASAKSLSRSSAPMEGASQLESAGLVLGLAGAGLVGVAVYEATKSDSPGS